MPDAPANPDEPKRLRSANNQRIAAYITASARFILTASTDTEILAIIALCGCDEEEFAEGRALVKAAGKAWGVRTVGMGEEDAAVTEADRLLQTARFDYAQFREIARSNFPEPGARTALGLTGDIAEGFDTFITQATGSYTAGLEAAYTATLARRGYSPAVLGTKIAALEALTEAETDQTEAEGAAEGDTEARDLAYTALKTYMKVFRGTVKGALKGKSGLLAKLGL